MARRRQKIAGDGQKLRQPPGDVSALELNRADRELSLPLKHRQEIADGAIAPSQKGESLSASAFGNVQP